MGPLAMLFCCRSSQPWLGSIISGLGRHCVSGSPALLEFDRLSTMSELEAAEAVSNMTIDDENGGGEVAAATGGTVGSTTDGSAANAPDSEENRHLAVERRGEQLRSRVRTAAF